jgi:16S rRNA (cytosine967-C5)-methyltransferase
MAISAARRIAYDVLSRVETQHAYASDLLHASLTPKISGADAALATELSLGVLRQQRLLDFLIEKQSRKRIAALDREVVLGLRLGLYQLRFLDRIPVRAAIFESVEIIKRSRKKSAASFVNAVLRGAIEIAEGDLASLLPRNISRAEWLGVVHSHPTWLVARWLARFGEAQTIALLVANNRASEVAGVIHDPSEREEIVRSLEKAGLQIKPGRWLKDAFRASGGSVSQTTSYRKGQISIQDEASQIVPLLLGVRQGDAVLDLCAAPGGKTAALARAAGSGSLVVAADRHAHRVTAISTNCARLGLRNVRIVELDGTCALPFQRNFTRVLIDAPCSGTGTLARNPEIRWRLREDDLPDLHQRQVALLRSGLRQLESGGRLVYSTCSLEPEENEAVIEEAKDCLAGYHRVGGTKLAEVLAPSFSDLAECSKPATEAISFLNEAGTFQALPSVHFTDGFYAVTMERQ